MTNLETELAKLNADQLAATTHYTGPALVLAGAGSGKTKVLTTRAAWLMAEKGVLPSQILLVTFTNKAAMEMKQRVLAVSGAKLEMAGTFHSLCAKILRRHAPQAGLDFGFSIYDNDDQLTLLKNIYKTMGWDPKQYKPASIQGAISRAKNNLLTPTVYEEQATGDFASFTARAYKVYQHQLRDENAVDFDDLLNYTVWLFRDHPEVLERYREQIKFVLVDEYQDTNKAQYLLTKYLAQPLNNLFVVGDFSQSIYAWRGADYKNMEYLNKDFPGLKKYYLEQNYRSLQAILTAATKVISKNSDHPILDLWTDNDQETKIQVIEASTSQQEAEEIATQIDQLQHRENYDLSEIAILYRTNAQSRVFEEALTRWGIPYRLVGGFKFYERKEVKDLLAYLRVIVNPRDNVSLTRLVKIGKRRLAKFETWRTEKPEEVDLTKPGELLKKIIQVTGYRDFFEKDDPEDITRWENVEELINSASLFTDTAQFLENVALIQDDYLVDENLEKEAKPQVTMMSLHSAKGLEFRAVFMVGMEEGLLPHSRSLFDPVQLAEERRLCYVGMTRAKEKLCLSFAKQRWQYGDIVHAQQSQFLADVPPELLEWEVKADEWRGDQGWSAPGRGGAKQKTWQNQSYRKPTWEKSLGDGRKMVIDESLLDDLLRDDIDIADFLEK